MAIHAIKSKIERALRNDTGATLTFDQLRELCAAGFLHRLALLEADEICRSVGVQPPRIDDIDAILSSLGRDDDEQGKVPTS